MALPATDTFNGIGTNDQLHEYSSNWVLVEDTDGVGGRSDKCKAYASASTVEGCHQWDADTFDNDHYAQLDTWTLSTTSTYLGPAVRCGGSASGDYYGAYCDDTGAYLFLMNNSEYTQLDFTTSAWAGEIRLEVIDDDLVCYDDDVEIMTKDNETTHASGKAGICCYGYVNVLTISADNFYADNLAAAGLSVSVSDTVSFTDVMGGQDLPIPANLNDVFSFAELIQGIMSGLESSISDSVSFSDVLNSVISIEPNVSDSMSFGEAVSLSVRVMLDISDTISFSEAVSASVSGLMPSSADTFSFSELIKSVVSISPKPADTMGLSEAVSLVVDIITNASDSITFSEALSAVISDLLVSTSDTFNIADVADAAFEGIVELEPSLSDTIGFLESLQARMVLSGINVTDSISFTESLATRLNIEQSVFDTIAISDSVSVNPVQVSGNTSDQIDVSDLVQMNVSLGLGPSDSVSFSELVSLFMVLGGIAIFDQISFSEVISGRMSIPNISVSDSFGLSEGLSASVATPVETAILIGLHDGKPYLQKGNVVTEL